MATTAQGLPYPLGTDKVVDGDNAIRALAEQVATYPPFLHARSTATQSISGSWQLMSTALPAGAAEVSRVTWAPALATIQVAGLYRVTGNLRFTGNSPVIALQITLNSAAVDTGVIAFDYLNGEQVCNATGLVRLAAGDILRMFGYASATLANGPTGAMFAIEWVRA